MLVNNSEIKTYLEDFHSGRIAQGLGIGCRLDDHIRFKAGTLNVILGHDNTGKTYFMLWYYLCLAVKHNIKFGIWTGENKPGQVMRDLIQQYSGKYFNNLSISEIYRYEQELSQYFIFVDNRRTYKAEELLKIFQEEGVNCGMIDPYTGLDRGFSHSDNYEFLNMSRQWTNETGIKLDVCTHPISASGRANGMYPKGHEFEGYLRIPFKADTEGGKPFQNRCDDFLIIHRLTKHPTMKTYTMVSVDKIKDSETGGSVTSFNDEILCEFNKGLGFKIDGVDPLRDKEVKPVEGHQQKPLTPNKGFEASVEHAKKQVEYEWLNKDPDEIDF